MRLNVKFRWVIGFVFFMIFFSGYAYSKPPKKMIVYCGVTMSKPMTELAKAFEKENGCRIRFVNGGSGKLLKLLLKNKNGDLYLPGSDSYIKKIDTEYPGLITSKASVGYNKAALFVRKGNPKKIPADLNALQDENIKVLIGSPEKGSIGKETKKILINHGSWEKVKAKVNFTEHSKSLVSGLKSGKIDLTINWFAASTWAENRMHVEPLDIDEAYAKKKKLVLTVLSDSKHPKLAKAFLDFVSSSHGKAVFKVYGLGE